MAVLRRITPTTLLTRVNGRVLSVRAIADVEWLNRRGGTADEVLWRHRRGRELTRGAPGRTCRTDGARRAMRGRVAVASQPQPDWIEYTEGRRRGAVDVGHAGRFAFACMRASDDSWN